MKLKHGAFLATALSLGAAMSVQAGEIQVKEAETRLKAFVQKNGKEHPGYATKLMIMAKTYQREGMRAKADAMFSQALGLKEKEGAYFAIDTLLSWSSALFEKKTGFDFKPGTGEAQKKAVIDREKKAEAADRLKAFSLLEKAEALSMKLQVDHYRRFAAQIEIIRKGDRAKSELAEKKLIGQVEAGLKGANPSTTVRLASVYSQLANIHTYGAHRSIDRACELQSEYLALMDRLPKQDPRRVRANRNAVGWYRKVGREDKAKTQTDKLAAMLGTKDPDKLFPKPKPCYACGRG